jgi:hypothetical protein
MEKSYQKMREKLRYFLVIFIIIFIVPVLSFGQEINKTTENLEENKKISYSFITEHGFCLGREFFAYEGVLVNSIRLNKTQDEIGVGTGFRFNLMGMTSIPVFANYRHYFPSKTDLQLFLNFAAGTHIAYLENPCKAGLYTTLTTGFTVKAFSFSSGFYVISYDEYFFGGIAVKLGYTFNKNKK